MPVETNSPNPYASGAQGGSTAQGASSAVGNPGGSIQDAMETSRNRLNSAYESVQQRSNELLEDACGYVEQHPMQSVIYAASIGAVVGLVAGLILGERSSGSWHKRFW
jgi:ElaB/YqjD/DUF883 family membrane-anchored ribosome-binding protein